MKLIVEWKKVFESDLAYIVSELKDNLSTPSMVILSGPVGAGKTTFAKYFKSHLGTKDENEVLSPTYSLINDYGRVVHADLYRIQDTQELIHLEIPLYLDDKDYFLVEWGLPHYKFLSQEVGEKFEHYQLKIEINQNGQTDESDSSRNFLLYRLNS